MTKILALDPGPTETAWAYFNPEVPSLSAGKQSNDEVLKLLGHFGDVELAIEMVASYGKPAGAELFETCRWIGRFEQAFFGRARLIYRKDVKMHLCGSTAKVNDAVIRQRMIDLYGKQGTKKEPGFTYGLKKDMWQAFALAVTAAETNLGRHDDQKAPLPEM